MENKKKKTNIKKKKTVIKKKKAIIIGIVIIVVIGIAALLFFPWEKAPEGIVIGSSNLPDSLNPILEQNTPAINANELVFDGLVNFEVDAASGKIGSEYAIAESITQDPVTKKIYTVTLRQMNWHDGTEVTANDVVFSYKAYIEPANKSPKREYLLSFIEDVKAIDDKTVKISFRKPIPPFRVFPVLTFKIIPETYNGKKLAFNLRSGENERLFAVQPIGTGPFKLASWEIGKWLTFSANPGYFKRVPAAGTLIIRKSIDPIIRLNELRKGRINLILETSPLDRPKVEGIKGIDINWYTPYAFYKVAINSNAPLFNNVYARKALSTALDRSTLVPKVTDRKESVLNYGPFPSNLFSLNMKEYNVKPLEDTMSYDIAKAQKLAVSGGINEKTAILLYPDSLGEFGKQVSEGLVRQYAKIGLTVTAKRTGDQVFNRLVFVEKNYELALLYCEGFDNLYSDLDKWYRSDGVYNISGIRDHELDKLFDTWDKTIKMLDWTEVTRQIHDRILSNTPAVYLFTLEKDVYSRNIKNIVIASDNPFLSAENWSLAGR
jgi:ABC-type transport system substrate-binding protein